LRKAANSRAWAQRIQKHKNFTLDERAGDIVREKVKALSVE